MNNDKDEFKDKSKNDLIREVKALKALLSDHMSAAPGVGTSVEVQGIVSFKTKKPWVVMRAGEAVWQMSPAAARQHAFLVHDAAIESERDAAIIAFLEVELQFDEHKAGIFLEEMQNHRMEWFEEFKALMNTVEYEEGGKDG